MDYKQFIEFSKEIVVGDFPLLVGLEAMRTHKLILNYGTNMLSDVTQSWALPIEYKRGQSFIADCVTGAVVLFTRP